MITAPGALQRARLVDALCQRWGCLPSALLQEDAGLVFGILGVLGEAEGLTEARPEAPSMEQQLADASRTS